MTRSHVFLFICGYWEIQWLEEKPRHGGQAGHCRPPGNLCGPLGVAALLTRLHRMGRKMVMVAGLLTNSVTMDTRIQASSVTAHGGRLLKANIWCPIHVERPELCRKRRCG